MNDSFFMDDEKTPRRWNVAISVLTLKQVKNILGVNLSDVIDIDTKGRPKADLLGRIAGDPVLLIDILYVICKSQADERNMTSEQFGEMFTTGEMIEAATDAFMNGILNFLPPTKRLVMQKILSIASRNTEKIRQEAEKILNDPKTDAELDKIWNEQFTNTLESSV